MSARALVCVREHSGTKGSERLILVELAGFAHDDGSGAWPRVETIADRTGLNRRTVQHALYGDQRREDRGGKRGGLVPAGLVEVKRQGGKHGVNLYRVVLCPSCVPGPHEESDRALRAYQGRTTRVPSTHQGAYQGRTNTVNEVRQEVGAASPSPPRRRAGKAAQNHNPADNGRVQVNDRQYRDLPEKSTGMSKLSKAQYEQTMRELRQGATVHELRVPGQDAPPAHEAGTGTWG